MKAVVIDRFKEPGAVREIPDPVLEPDAVIIRITRAGINPIDWKVRDGEAGARTFPFVLGQDVAGVVERVGVRVSRVKAGDRVFGVAREHGAYAELTMIQEARHDSPFSVIPDGVSDAQAAALPTPGLTAFAAVVLLGVTKGTRLLIVGAAGSVGSAAVQIAHGRGAQVTGIVRPGQGDGVRQLGADATGESVDELLATIRAGKAEAFDAVLDLVSDGDTLKKNVALVQKGGKLVTTVHVADEPWFRERDVEATNISMFETPQSSPEGLDRIAKMVADGSLKVDVAAEEPLDDAPRVLDDVKAGKLKGKVDLQVR
ncbi:MAG TPA: NADP-dependent oxidoreductase [Candidatus Acidoferrales bacterium]|nr:NADP-dependent oxidoreductase [Candidatus Acidoferrales bacterium]